MARHHKPKNPIDPGSKLTIEKTLAILHYLLTGRQGVWIAEKVGVSKNSVSSLSARFRRKLYTSPAVRQSCFELFYEAGVLSRTGYLHFLDFPDGLPNNYYADVANCAFRCPGQFLNKAQNWSRFIFASNKRVLNLRQSQKFMNFSFGKNAFFLRDPCDNCAALANSPIKYAPFFAMCGFYLRSRNMRAQHVEEYYLMYAIFYLLYNTTINQLGIYWSSDEILLPPESEWPDLPQKIVLQLISNAKEVLEYSSGFLLDDPLN